MTQRGDQVRWLIIVFILLLPATEAVAEAQESHRGTAEGARFGAPVVKCTVIRDQGAVMIGGRGGWNITPSWLLGAGAYGTTTEISSGKNALPDSLGPMNIQFESFGCDLEYAANPDAPTHLTWTAFFGGGAAHYMLERTDDQDGETDFVLLLEPAMGVEQRITDWLHLNLALSYRLVGGTELSGLKNSDLNGPGVSLAAKFGRF
jgi:hypothetical protein